MELVWLGVFPKNSAIALNEEETTLCFIQSQIKNWVSTSAMESVKTFFLMRLIVQVLCSPCSEEGLISEGIRDMGQLVPKNLLKIVPLTSFSSSSHEPALSS